MLSQLSPGGGDDSQCPNCCVVTKVTVTNKNDISMPDRNPTRSTLVTTAKSHRNPTPATLNQNESVTNQRPALAILLLEFIFPRCFAPTRESLFLRSIVRTRFQFIRLTLVAVEVNDLLGFIPFFGHSASPSETIRVASVYWLANAEAPASQVASASCYRFPENIFLFSVVKSKLKFVQVQRQIFFADVVVGADDSALDERPERFHRVRMNDAANILAFAMVHGVMWEFLPSRKVLIARMFIGRDQFNSILVHDSINESMQRRHIGVLDHLADNVSFASYRADDRRFVASASDVALLVPMAIFILAADVGFVHFHDSHKQTEIRIVQSSAQTMAHIKSRLVGTGIDHPMNLHRADSLLGNEHQVQNLKPRSERVIRILENCADVKREPISRFAALVARPMEWTLSASRINLLIAASRATDTVGPTLLNQIFLASRFIGEHPLEIPKAQLLYDFRFVAVSFFLNVHNRHVTTNSGLCQVRHTRLK
jgi:hypothetical protein